MRKNKRKRITKNNNQKQNNKLRNKIVWI
jgi:hypothetical protein